MKGDEIRPFIPVYRDFFSGPLWIENREYSRAEAWLYLLATARFGAEPISEVMGGRIVSWSRGQLPGSIRFLSGKWQWSKDRVDRFLKYLVNENMIEISQNGGQSIITIVEFQEFTKQGQPQGQPPRHEQGQLPRQPNPEQQRISADGKDSLRDTNKDSQHGDNKDNKEESKEKGKEESKKKNTVISDRFEIFWSLYDMKVDRKAAEKAWNGLTDQERQKAITAAPDYVKATPARQYRKYPATWLNQKSFENELIENHGRSNLSAPIVRNGKSTGAYELLGRFNAKLKSRGIDEALGNF